MKVRERDFVELLAPRCTVLISTIDKEGRPNAAPFSFVTPVCSEPPWVLFATTRQRHTLANVRETGEFVLNIVPEQLLDNLWTCSKEFPRGVNEIRESGLSERKSTIVTAPGIQECISWIECQMEFEKAAGDNILVVGKVVHAECRDEFFKEGQFDVSQAKPVTHIWDSRFVIPGRTTEPTNQ